MRPWSTCRRVWVSSTASMSSWVAPAMRMRVPASEISLRALGSVHRLSPVLSGVLTTAGVHSLCWSSWKETVPLVKARRPTRPGGSLCAWAAPDQMMAAPTIPATKVTAPRRKSVPNLASLEGFALQPTGTPDWLGGSGDCARGRKDEPRKSP